MLRNPSDDTLARLANIDAKALAANIKEHVIGQDKFVDELSAWFATAMRCRVLRMCDAQNADDYPNMQVALVNGPTASGKTHTFKTLCRMVDGVECKLVDTSAITGEGWYGNSISNVLWNVALEQQRDESLFLVIIWDEFDKAVGKGNDKSFDPQSNLLQLFESDVYPLYDKNANEQMLDCKRIIHLLTGTFSEREHHIRGFMGAKSVETQGLTFDDLIDCGASPELCGRIDRIFDIDALDEDAIAQIVSGSEHSLERKYANVLPPSTRLLIDRDATELIAKNSVAAKTGARGAAAIVSTTVSNALATTDIPENHALVISAENGAITTRVSKNTDGGSQSIDIDGLITAWMQSKPASVPNSSLERPADEETTDIVIKALGIERIQADRWLQNPMKTIASVMTDGEIDNFERKQPFSYSVCKCLDRLFGGETWVAAGDLANNASYALEKDTVTELSNYMTHVKFFDIEYAIYHKLDSTQAETLENNLCFYEMAPKPMDGHIEFPGIYFDTWEDILHEAICDLSRKKETHTCDWPRNVRKENDGQGTDMPLSSKEEIIAVISFLKFVFDLNGNSKSIGTYREEDESNPNFIPDSIVDMVFELDDDANDTFIQTVNTVLPRWLLNTMKAGHPIAHRYSCIFGKLNQTFLENECEVLQSLFAHYLEDTDTSVK